MPEVKGKSGPPVPRFNDIADLVLEHDPGADLELLQRAYVFTAKVHEGQERLSGEPYLVHPIAVAQILANMRMDAITVATGLLHDTIEDTLADADELRQHFGEEVTFLVEGLTKIARIEFTSHRERQAENFRKMLVAMSKDIRILLIKLADRLHNMRTLEFMKEDSARRIATETLEIYAPLAHRLGIDWMKRELENLAFRTLHRQTAEALETRLATNRKERDTYIDEVIGQISEKLEAAGLQAEINGRMKELSSIHAKMESQGVDLDQIYDVIAFRIVLEGGQESVYTALGIIHGTWRPISGRFKDYVALPKPNGYQSLHTAVIGPYGERMEVQIRTLDMHRAAELGIAAHWKYKEGRVEGDEDDRKFAWLRQLLEWQRDVSDPHEFLDTVKVDLFPDQVFVFTPRGEVMTLPADATPVDFAYSIHSEVGAHCAGAKVNGKMVPLRHTLVDGDTVEILTSHAQVPRKDWLEFVVSGKARNRIRHAVRSVERERSRALGREMLDRELRKAGESLARMTERGQLAEIAAKETRGGSIDDLFAAVGFGRLPAAKLVRKIKGIEEPDAAPKRRSIFRRPKPPSRSGIRVSGFSDVMVRFARCCSPIPGDDVIGFVTRGRGVTVHGKGCAKVFGLDPERRIDVDWDNEAEVAHRIKLRVSSSNRPGILATVTKSISAAGVNIDGARVSTDSDNKAVSTFELWVKDVSTLDAVMKEIKRVKGVLTVERVRA